MPLTKFRHQEDQAAKKLDIREKVLMQMEDQETSITHQARYLEV
jgi:hypothetical protein